MYISIRDIALMLKDWQMLRSLKAFFLIFVSLSQKLQASQYPTLNFAIPQYLKMINKLQDMQRAVGIHLTISSACTVAIKKLNEYYTLIAN